MRIRSTGGHYAWLGVEILLAVWDDGSVAALRYLNWKVTFLKQNALGLRVWQQPFEELRAPLLTNLRMDPFERAEEENAMGYQRWYMEHMFAIAPAGANNTERKAAATARRELREQSDSMRTPMTRHLCSPIERWRRLYHDQTGGMAGCDTDVRRSLALSWADRSTLPAVRGLANHPEAVG